MGTGKKEANRKVRQGKVGDGMANVRTKGENFYRYALCALLSVKKKCLADLMEEMRRRSSI
jgi:nuclear GTP-binding protein